MRQQQITERLFRLVRSAETKADHSRPAFAMPHAGHGEARYADGLARLSSRLLRREIIAEQVAHGS
jgi:hypothetical protein